MNVVKLTGRVLNAYKHDLSGAFITKIAVRHDHIVGRQSISCESVFNVVMLDEAKINLGMTTVNLWRVVNRRENNIS